MDALTINDLLERLQAAADAGYGGTPILLVHQESYPLVLSIRGVATPDDDPNPDDEDLAAFLNEIEYREPVAYLVAGDRPDDVNPYGPAWPFAAVPS